jgi:hypothetical protein
LSYLRSLALPVHPIGVEAMTMRELDKLDRVMRNQRRVFFVNIVATAMFAGGIIASLAALL